MYRVKTQFGAYDVELRPGKYWDNGGLAIQLFMDTGEPFATLTVNLCRLNWGYAYLDTNNCPWAEDFVKKYGIAEPTGKSCVSGWCEYPLYKFDMKKIGEVE